MSAGMCHRPKCLIQASYNKTNESVGNSTIVKRDGYLDILHVWFIFC